MQKQHSSLSPRGNGASGGSSGSPKTPFMERMKQTLGGGGGGAEGGGGKGSNGASGSNGSPGGAGGSPNNNTLPRSTTAGVLRRKDRDTRSALSFAARAFTEVVDTVEQAAKKVSLGSIATAVANIARDKKTSTQSSQLPGPPGVTQACSVIFQHVLSPLWAMELSKPMSVPSSYVSFQSPECVRMMRHMEAVSAQQASAAAAPSSSSASSATHHSNTIRMMLENLRPVLEPNTDLATAFLIFMCAKLRWVESQDTLPILDIWASPKGTGSKGDDKSGGGGAVPTWSSTTGPTYEQLIMGLREEYLRRDDEFRFEDRVNDECQTADHQRRRLEEVGGRQWRPKGANLLPYDSHELRHQLLSTILYASVTLTYNYYDPLLQFVVDEICCKQMFLTSFSEGFSQLVAGVKGPKYLSKYITFLCRDTLKGAFLDGLLGGGGGGGLPGSGGAMSAGVSGGGAGGGDGSGAASSGGGTSTFDRTSHFYLTPVGVESVILQDVMRSLELAFQNFIHRNDVSHVLFTAFHRSVTSLATDGDRTSTTALFFRITSALQVSYVADLELLVTLVDTVKPLVAKPNPIGFAALQLLKNLFASLRDVNTMQRQTLSRLFVGGPEHSFRRVPSYAIISPYCARAALISQVYWGEIDQRRASNVKAPAVVTHGRDPYTGDPYPQLDDATVCVANHLINIFQALHELELLGENRDSRAVSPVAAGPPQRDDEKLRINLRLLFSINPTTLASIFPTVLHAVEKAQQEAGTKDPAMLRPTDMEPEVLRTLQEMYLLIQDRHRPASGAVRFRNEAPRLPVVPLRVHRYFEKDDLEVMMKSMMDDYSTSCDARIRDKDVAFLHPENHISLRMFVDSSMKVLIGGGSGLLRRAVSASMRLQQTYPGAYVRPLFYVLPLGYGNDIAAWLSRGDSIYRERIFNLFLSQAIKMVDPPTFEQWSGSLLLTPASFASTSSSGGGASGTAASAAAAAPQPSAGTGSGPAVPQVSDSITSLLTRDAINDFVTFATQTNDVVIYQAECTFVDSNYGSCFIPFVSNFEVGSHINTAVQSAYRSGSGAVGLNGVLQPNPNLHTSSFSMLGEKLRQNRSSASILSRQNTNQSNSSGESSNNLKAGVSTVSFASPSTAGPQTSFFGGNNNNNNISSPVVSVNTPAFTISIGDRTESLDRVLTRMHGQRGIPLSTKLHVIDGTELPSSVSGDHVLDWISTTYHLYDLGIARSVAQSLLDSKLLVSVCVPVGKELHKFHDAGIYTVLAREDPDAQPLCPPSSRSALCEHSNWCRMEFEDLLCNNNNGNWGGGGGQSGGGRDGPSNLSGMGGGGAVGNKESSGGPATVPIRVTFQSYFNGALQYNDLVDSKEQSAHRDIISLKVKSAGAAEDLGPLPNPCVPTLVMSSLQSDGKKKGSGGGGASSGRQQRDICDIMDHYQIKFGERQLVDPRSTLQLEWRAPPSTAGTNSSVVSGMTSDALAFGPISTSSFGTMPTDNTASSFVFSGGKSLGTVRPDSIGMYCMFDGDVFGPFSFVKIKPVTTRVVHPGDAQHPPRSNFATAAVMSFVKPM
jgi:hypothetical protein